MGYLPVRSDSCQRLVYHGGLIGSHHNVDQAAAGKAIALHLPAVQQVVPVRVRVRGIRGRRRVRIRDKDVKIRRVRVLWFRQSPFHSVRDSIPIRIKQLRIGLADIHH